MKLDDSLSLGYCGPDLPRRPLQCFLEYCSDLVFNGMRSRDSLLLRVLLGSHIIGTSSEQLFYYFAATLERPENR